MIPNFVGMVLNLGSSCDPEFRGSCGWNTTVCFLFLLCYTFITSAIVNPVVGFHFYVSSPFLSCYGQPDIDLSLLFFLQQQSWKTAYLFTLYGIQADHVVSISGWLISTIIPSGNVFCRRLDSGICSYHIVIWCSADKEWWLINLPAQLQFYVWNSGTLWSFHLHWLLLCMRGPWSISVCYYQAHGTEMRVKAFRSTVYTLCFTRFIAWWYQLLPTLLLGVILLWSVPFSSCLNVECSI